MSKVLEFEAEFLAWTTLVSSRFQSFVGTLQSLFRDIFRLLERFGLEQQHPKRIGVLLLVAVHLSCQWRWIFRVQRQGQGYVSDTNWAMQPPTKALRRGVVILPSGPSNQGRQALKVI